MLGINERISEAAFPDTVKEQLMMAERVAAITEMRAAHGLPVNRTAKNLILIGTNRAAAREYVTLFASILHGHGQLATDETVFVSVADLLRPYVGQSAKRTDEVLRAARGKLILIENADDLLCRRDGFEAEVLFHVVAAYREYGDDLIIALSISSEDAERKLSMSDIGFLLHAEKINFE